MDNYLIGIDIGGTMIKGALFDSHGGLLKKDETATDAAKGEKQFIANIAGLVTSLQSKNTKACAVGLGVAGVLDKDREHLLESPNLPFIKNLPLRSKLEGLLNLPVFLENDANIAALGELWVGEGQELENFLLITLGTGIGSGLILNKTLWSGELGKAGEFGHLVVNPAGALCGCGKRGCLEAHSSGRAMINMAAEALAAGKVSCLRDQYDDNPELITPKIIYTEAQKGDALCLEIFKQVSHFLAIGISNVNNLLDINNFIIGGGVGKAAGIFEAGMHAEIQQLVFNVSRDKIRIMLSKLGNDAGIFGAGYLAKQRIEDM